RCAAQGTRILTRLDPGYPRLLFDLPLPPPVLFLRGELPAGPAVAIVGSRRADAYGREAARAFAGDLARAGLGIVSGFARGIDEAAHRGALEAGGWTAGVLGCGVDVDYPRHRPELRRAMDSTGA